MTGAYEFDDRIFLFADSNHEQTVFELCLILHKLPDEIRAMSAYEYDALTSYLRWREKK